MVAWERIEGMSELDYYFKRIGYSRPQEPTLDTLRAIHRAHLFSIPYENLDIHLGRPLVLDEAGFFEKLVLQRRGGWCYEMNGLLAWALRELGFKVELLSGAVGREQNGDGANANHLVLLVTLDQPYIADVGFGDGFLEPLPLQTGRYQQEYLSFGLSESNGRWIFHNHEHGGAKSFDFTLEPHDLSAFANKCYELQTSPESGFVRTTVCQRFFLGQLLTMRGAVLKTISANGVEQRVIESEAEYVKVLEEGFGLSVDTGLLWPKVWQRHQEWLAGQ